MHVCMNKTYVQREKLCAAIEGKAFARGSEFELETCANTYILISFSKIQVSGSTYAHLI